MNEPTSQAPELLATPRTESESRAHFIMYGTHAFVSVRFARTLERELALARRETGESREACKAQELGSRTLCNCLICSGFKLLSAERDKLREERDSLKLTIQTDFMSGVAMELEKERDSLRASNASLQKERDTWRKLAGEASRSLTLNSPLRLHPQTTALVLRFSVALAEKLRDAEDKCGYSDDWRNEDWMDECRTKLREHVEKGDPRDVAAYCAFLWHHNQSTADSNAASLQDRLDAALAEISRGRHGVSGLCCQLRAEAVAKVDELSIVNASLQKERDAAMVRIAEWESHCDTLQTQSNQMIGVAINERDEWKAANASLQEQVARLRAGLVCLRDHELSCSCTSGSFIYGCNKCRIRCDIIEPTLAPAAPVGEEPEGTYTLEQLIDLGWSSADAPPDTDRDVQIAYEDGSHSEKTIGFYDSKSGNDRQKFWWARSFGRLHCVEMPGVIIAWRERPAPSQPKQEGGE